MNKHTIIAMFVGLLVLTISLTTIYTLNLVSARAACAEVEGGCIIEEPTKPKPNPYNSCDPVDVAKKCCEVTKSNSQCKNYCNQRGAACGWDTGQTGTCKTDVDSNNGCTAS